MRNPQIDALTEQRLRESIAQSLAAIDSYSRKGQDNYASEIRECRERLFNAYITLGEFDNAARYTDSIRSREDECEALREAVNRNDNEMCSCTPAKAPVKNGHMNLPNVFAWKRIKSQKHNAWISVYRCTICGFLQAAPVCEAARALTDVRASGKVMNDREAFK